VWVVLHYILFFSLAWGQLPIPYPLPKNDATGYLRSEMQLLTLIVLQINTFMVFAIIGCVFSAIQLIVAADGASNVDTYYGNSYNSKVSYVSVM